MDELLRLAGVAAAALQRQAVAMENLVNAEQRRNQMIYDNQVAMQNRMDAFLMQLRTMTEPWVPKLGDDS